MPNDGFHGDSSYGYRSYLFKRDCKLFFTECANVCHDLCDLLQNLFRGVQGCLFSAKHDPAGALAFVRNLLKLKLDWHPRALPSVPREDCALGDVLEETGFSSVSAANDDDLRKLLFDFRREVRSNVVHGVVENAEGALPQMAENAFDFSNTVQDGQISSRSRVCDS